MDSPKRVAAFGSPVQDTIHYDRESAPFYAARIARADWKAA